ncbi:helix-turn-helix domain-containing protein [Streptomyces sp. NPDC002499]
MSETTRSPGSSSEVERGEVPELATLGTMVRSLFITLDISQRQYAHRVHLDPSAVSRYLSGRRVPPRHFVERLIAEVESERGGSVTPEVREKFENTWLAALKACNPGEYQLENLRTDLARSRRDTERANRTVEALQLLLEQKESQVREAGRELAGLQADWAADRAEVARTEIESQPERESPAASRDALLREIEHLRSDLCEAVRLRGEAEKHSRELRDLVLRLEAQLAERGAMDEAPMDVFKAQLEQMWEDENFPEATRELTEAAWARPVDDVVDLLRWLMERDADGRAVPFMADVGRLRPVDDVLRVVKEWVSENELSRSGDDALAVAIASRITLREVAAFCQGLAELGPFGKILSDEVLTEAVFGASTAAYAVDLVIHVLEGQETLDLFRATAQEMAGLYLRYSLPYLVALGLFEAGRFDAADVLLGAAASLSRTARDSADEAGSLYVGLEELDGRSLRTLFAFMAAQSSQETAARFAQAVYREAARSSDPGPLEQLAVLGPKVRKWVDDHPGSLSTELIDYLDHLEA